MKKLVFMFVAFAAVSFASCGNQTANDAPVVDSDSVAIVDSLDSVADSLSAVADSVKAAADSIKEGVVAE